MAMERADKALNVAKQEGRNRGKTQGDIASDLLAGNS